MNVGITRKYLSFFFFSGEREREIDRSRIEFHLMGWKFRIFSPHRFEYLNIIILAGLNSSVHYTRTEIARDIVRSATRGSQSGQLVERKVW